MNSCWFCEGTEGVFHGVVHEDFSVCATNMRKAAKNAAAAERERLALFFDGEARRVPVPLWSPAKIAQKIREMASP